VPDPDGPGRERELEQATRATPAALGPTASPAALAGSWSAARATLRLLEARSAAGLARADETLTPLLLFENEELVARIATRRLAPLDDLTPKARARMEETALAYVQQQGNAAAMARALDLHPQTVRYRLTRLRELLGDDLDDPDARFELELALRAAAPAAG
jgi:DNA-binding PucR family transcriptional regulator